MGEQGNYKRVRLDLYLNEENPVDVSICKYLLSFKAGRARNAEVRAALALYVATSSNNEQGNPVPEQTSSFDMAMVLEKLEALTNQVNRIQMQMKQTENINVVEKSQYSDEKKPSEQIEHLQADGTETNIYPAVSASEYSGQEPLSSADMDRSIMDISDDVLEFVQSL